MSHRKTNCWESLGSNLVRWGDTSIWGKEFGEHLKVTRYQVEAGVAELRLFRPKRMNAWTGRMHTEYRYSLLQAAEDPEVGAIVVMTREPRMLSLS